MRNSTTFATAGPLLRVAARQQRKGAALTGAFLALVLTLPPSPALAQTLGDNEVYIGQTGETNTIRIDQRGNFNTVGGAEAGLPLTQDGLVNRIEIDQTGFGNSVADNNRDGARLSLGFVQTGTAQIGNRNVIEIVQETQLLALARTAIEAIIQSASRLFDRRSPWESNRLYLRQFSPNAPGGSQTVGQVAQTNTSDEAFNGVTNLVSIIQQGDSTGVGNTVTTALQEGAGNDLLVEQSESGNSVDTSRQVGVSNQAQISQLAGIGNTVLAVDQIGSSNELRLTQHGSQNYIAGVYQNNEGVAISGNMVSLTLTGSDNGGDGTGGIGEFSLVPAGFVLFQSMISQNGDDNSLAYVTAAGAEGNLFGFEQDGDGNGVTGFVTGSDNETAVRQTGDDNNLVFKQDGDQNAQGASFEGERNRAELEQTGSRNMVTLAVVGNGNNGPAAGFTGESLAASIIAELPAGVIRQIGALNSFNLVLIGDLNAFAALQRGDENEISGFIDGTGNQAFVTQLGDKDAANFRQIGNGNILRMRQ